MTTIDVAWVVIGLSAVVLVGLFGIVWAMSHYLSARIDSLGKSVGGRIDALGARLDGRIDALAARLQTHIERHGS